MNVPIKHRRLAADYYRNAPFMSPEWFDAIPGGTVDASNELLRAMAEAAEDGRALDGAGQTFGVDFANIGAFDLIDGAWLRNMTLKQLSPGASQSVITVLGTDVSNVRLEGFKVNRNGDGTNDGNNSGTTGALATAHGMFITGGTGHHFEDIEVYGDDSGTGMWFAELDYTTKIIRPYVHDMLAVVNGATDDCVEGMFFAECSGLQIWNPRNHYLSFKDTIGGAESYENSRGLCFSGCSDLTIYSARCSFMNQGIDHTGNLGNGNVNITHINPYVWDINFFGIKAANRTRNLLIYRGKAERCGVAGFTDSSVWTSARSDFDANWYINCEAIDCGSGVGTNGGFTKTGSGLFNTPAKYFFCRANDTRGTPLMDYGFYNEIADVAGNYSAVINCLVDNAQDTDFRDITDETPLVSSSLNQEASIRQLTVTQDFVTSRDPRTLANGDNHNLVTGGAVMRVAGPTGAFAITGIDFNLVDQHLWIYNTTSQMMTIKNQNAGSTVGFRIKTRTGADVTLPAAESYAHLWYDGAASNWVLFGSG